MIYRRHKGNENIKQILVRHSYSQQAKILGQMFKTGNAN
jgi:hypothetical protein